MASINWLHLTDLHDGEPLEKRLWPNVEQKFTDDLARLHQANGGWDVVFFTGDLTNRGTPADFERLGKTLGELWGEFRKLGCDPVLLAVPGNHDLVRPDEDALAVKLLKKWDDNLEEFRRDFWTTGKKEYRDLVKEAFAPFVKWYEGWRTAHPHPVYDSWKAGVLPGDFSTTIEKEGLRIGVVGLNTAYLQLTGDDYHGRLAVDVEQLNEICGGGAPRWLERLHTAILLTHHPREWLHSDYQVEFNNEIAPAGRFFLHLYGHMHEPASEYIRIGGDDTLRIAQGASLFGVEHYRSQNQAKISRIHGYSAGRLEVDLSAPGEACLKVWPRIVKSRKSAKGGGYRLAPDWDNFNLGDDNAFTERVSISMPKDTPAEKLFRKCLRMSTPALLTELRRCRELAEAAHLDELSVARLRVEAQILGSPDPDPWKRVEEIARDLARPDATPPLIDVRTCYELIREETKTRIGEYFRVLHEDPEIRRELKNRDLRLLSWVRVKDGFLAPIHLLTGLLTHFGEDWTPVLAAFGRSVTEGDPAVWRMLQSFIFDCWLLWGPSIPICSCGLWTNPPKCGVALQYGYGDENNSIPVLLTHEQRDQVLRQLWTASQDSSGPAHGLARRVSVIGPLIAVGAIDGRVPIAQESITRGETYDYVLEYQAHELPAAESAGDYYSAYVWVMFEVNQAAQRSDTDRPWLRLLPFFEHTNIADGSTYDFMREQLSRKVLSFFRRYANETTTFRYVCAFDDPGHGGDVLPSFNRPTIKEKLAELLKDPGYDRIRDAVHMTSDDTRVACELPRLVTAFYEHVSLAEEPSAGR